MELTNVVQNYKENIIEIAKALGKAKADMKRKEYSNLIEVSGLSKDQVSLSLKRFFLLREEFSEDVIADYSDRMVKKLTNKAIDKNPELQKGRKQLAKGLISYEEFCDLVDFFKPVKTDDEKGVSKAKALVKFVDGANIGAEAMIEISNIVKPLSNYTEDVNEEE